MLLAFNDQQNDKLSELLLDLAKAAFIAGFSVNIFTKVDFLVSLKFTLLGLLFTYSSLYLTKGRIMIMNGIEAFNVSLNFLLMIMLIMALLIFGIPTLKRRTK